MPVTSRHRHVMQPAAVIRYVLVVCQKLKLKLINASGVQIENSFLSGPFLTLTPFFFLSDKCELTAGSDEKTQRSPAGDRTWVFRLPVGRSMKPRQEPRANFLFFLQTVSSFSLQGDPHVRAYKHVETGGAALCFFV